MVDPFAQLADGLFASDVASDVTYTPSGGSAATVRAIRPEETDGIDALDGFDDTRIRSAVGPVFRIRVSQVPIPAKGDTIVDGSETFTVSGPAKLERRGLVWRIPTKPA